MQLADIFIFCLFTIFHHSIFHQTFIGSFSDFSSSHQMYGIMLSTISGDDSKVFHAQEIA